MMKPNDKFRQPLVLFQKIDDCCVATSIAAEGMGLVNGENVLLGDTPQGFADAVVRMYTDAQTWEKCSLNGLAFIQEHYSLLTFEKNLSELLLAGLDVLPKFKS